MKEEQLLEGLKKIVPEGVEIDYTKLDIKAFNTFVNDDTNSVVASKKDGYIAEGRTNFLTEKGFKDVAAFDTFKTNAETSETGMTTKYTTLEGKYNTLLSTHDKLNVEVKTDKEIGRLKSTDEEGFRVVPKYGKFVHSEFANSRAAAKASGKELTMEEWATPYFEKNSQYQLPIKTGTRHRGTVIKSASDKKDFYETRYGSRGKKR